MDANGFLLHCNILDCRSVLHDKAIVTTCSHIFCMSCGEKAFHTALVCPACETTLTHHDDVVLTDLNPSEDYKSSVLAGLKPDVVMEIASRAISFWIYQTTQEAAYQNVVQRDLELKCTSLSAQMESLVRDANHEITLLQDRMDKLVKEQESERRRFHDMGEQLAEKNRQFQKLQAMYDKLKRKSLLMNKGSSAMNENNPWPTPLAIPVEQHHDSSQSFLTGRMSATGHMNERVFTGKSNAVLEMKKTKAFTLHGTASQSWKSGESRTPFARNTHSMSSSSIGFRSRLSQERVDLSARRRFPSPLSTGSISSSQPAQPQSRYSR